jgi:hypothetical protein
MYSFKGRQNIQNHAFPSQRCTSNEKTCYCYKFYNENHTYVPVHKPVKRKFYLFFNILAYCGYSPTCPFFFFLSKHKHCDNAATNSNSENARSRMVASLRGSVGTQTKEDESSTRRVWIVGFHQFTARSRLARVLKLTNPLFL